MNVTQAEIEDAFRKFQNYVYFENTDLHIRTQIVDFINEEGLQSFKKLASLLNRKDALKQMKPYLDKIRLRYYPKKVLDNFNGIKDRVPSNFVTNSFSKENCEISRLAIFCDMPVELHIVSIAWLHKFGYVLDQDLTPNCRGNRILFQKEKIGFGRTLFKPYFKQYQNWWSKGIKKADELLKEGENVTVLNFDIKDYFHSVELDFSALEAELSSHFGDISNHPLHLIFKKLHSIYTTKLQIIRHSSVTNKPNKYALPIGLLSSFVIGNWFLKGFDKYIQKQLIPSYYGRYVDDIFIVLKDRLIDDFNDVEQSNLKKYFNESGVNPNLGISGEGRFINTFNHFVYSYLKGFLRPVLKDEIINYNFCLPGLENLFLQSDKMFIYQFHAEMSPNLLHKFIEEQKERSSEFRFLSDEEDEGFDDFNETVFESNFEAEDVNKARFKLLDDNKFKLSVYLAKFIQKRVEKGALYKEDQIEKIEKYFKGTHLLRNYYFWEKLLTLYVVSGKKVQYLKLLKAIVNIIDTLSSKWSEDVPTEILKRDLLSHFLGAIQMSLGYNPKFLTQEVKDYLDQKSIHISPTFFRTGGLLRRQFIYYPLLQFTKKADESEISLIDSGIFHSEVWTDEDFDIVGESYIPCAVKFYDVCLLKYYQIIYSESYLEDVLRVRKNFIGIKSVLDASFNLFYKINRPHSNSSAAKGKVRYEYFKCSPLRKRDGLFHSIPDNVEVSELYLKNGGSKKEDYRIALVNKYVDSKNFESSLDGKPNLTIERAEMFDWMLDQVGQIKSVDIFVLPELALPHDYIKRFVRFSARRQIAFVSGVEHLRVGKIGFNFVLTCLPVNVNGDKDAIPILRLKNHYAPEEELWISGKYMVTPVPRPYRYDLFVWRDLYFSTYYCYELANIYHRAIFSSMVDLICAPVWNVDTHYYDHIIESATRDIHCYFVQANTSQYGDTRLTRPTDHIRKDKAKIKGGTVSDYKVTLAVGDIEVKKLRDFQSVAFVAQKELNKNKKSFKPTPPDFNLKFVHNRANGLRFGGR